MSERTPLLGTLQPSSRTKQKKRSGVRGKNPQAKGEGEDAGKYSAEEMELLRSFDDGVRKRPHPRRFRTIPHCPPPKPRYVTSVCTAKEYKMSELKQYFEERGLEVVDSTEVLFARYDTTANNMDEPAEVFFFQYGVVVWWGPSDSWGKLMVLSILKKFEVKPEEAIDLEVCDYSYVEDEKPTRQRMLDESELEEEGNTTAIEAEAEGERGFEAVVGKSTIWNDHFILGNRDWEIKLAFSHGLAQSAKLTVFEERIDKVIDETRRYPEYLADQGKVKLTRKEIARLRGRLFLHRMDINLHSDILDTPDFFWEHTELEPLYNKCRKYMEINKRVEILNQRLDVVHELFAMLSDELNQKHSAKLEWIIIWLILIEVIVGLVSISLSMLEKCNCPTITE